ncbi:MAG: MFS transporter [Fimbriimonas sp.]
MTFATTGYEDRSVWYARLSAYWFASSLKWFALLTVVLPRQVASVVPDGTKNTAWGMVFAVGAVWAVVGPSLFGAASDRTGRRMPYVAAGAGLTILALGMLAVANTVVEIALGYLLLQIADDIGTGPYAALIPEHIPENRRGRASGMTSLLSLTGQLAAAPLVLASRGDPRVTYGVIALATLIGATVACEAIGSLERNRPPSPGGPFWHGFFRGWVTPWKSRNFMWVWLTRMLFALGLYLTQPYLRNYLQDVVKTFEVSGWRLPGVDEATALLALSITVCAATGSLVGGSQADRIGRKAVILRGGGLMAVSLVPFLGLREFGALLAVALVFGFGYGIYLSADWALAADVMPDGQALGRDMGVWQMSVSAVQIFAGSAGRIVDWGNHAAPGRGYQITFGLAALAFSLGILTVRQVRVPWPNEARKS